MILDLCSLPSLGWACRAFRSLPRNACKQTKRGGPTSLTTALEGRLPRECSRSLPFSQTSWFIMHRSAWNRYSANFAFTEFSEVRRSLGALAHITLPPKGVWCEGQLIKVGPLALPKDGGRAYEAHLAVGCGDGHGVGSGQRGRLGGHHSGHKRRRYQKRHRKQ